MKKLLMVCLCLLLLVAFAVPAFAAGSVTLTSNAGTTVFRDGEFAVTVSVSGWDACTMGSAEVTCGNAFTLTGGEWVVPNPDISYFDTSAREGGFGYSSAKKLSGNVLRLYIKVKSNAAFAKDKITVVLNLGGTKVTKAIDISVACYHVYGNWAQGGEAGHSRKCTICGNVESGKHGFVHDCDTTCDTCGYEREITHQFAEEWTSDETGHWHSCSVCEARSDEAEHVPGVEAGEYTDQTCTVCNRVLSTALGHTHKYEDTYQSDENGHWKVCTGSRCGEATEAQPHVYDGDCDETCNDCGYVRQITHKDGEWEHNSASHWKTCSECSVRLNEGEHSWDAGYVKVEANMNQTGVRVFRCIDCMAEREEVIPRTAITDPAGGLAWWTWLIIGAGGGILVSAAIITVVILVGMNKKQGGRYSGRQ